MKIWWKNLKSCQKKKNEEDDKSIDFDESLSDQSRGDKNLEGTVVVRTAIETEETASMRACNKTNI